MTVNVVVREARKSDFAFVTKQMEAALDPYYGGDHEAHAKRIFDAHIAGGEDKIGFFSVRQKMFIAEVGNENAGLLHVVLKRQATCKISPLIVAPKFQKEFGVGLALLNKALSFTSEQDCRQLYCTVSAKNSDALKFFLRNGFSVGGRSPSQYLPGIDEHMLYRSVDEIVSDEEFDLDHISVLALDNQHQDQVRRILLDELPKFFMGIDDSWVDALFAGHERRFRKEIEEKYKLIFTATDRNNRVLGIAGATPKKGEPIKLMPFVALEPAAFFAILSDVPGLLREFGRKVYVHIDPTSEEVRFLQKAGWRLEGLLPDAYQVDRVTQQWSRKIDEDDFMKTLRLKKRYLDLMRQGKKTLEVRVGYANIKTLKSGEEVAFLSRDDRLVRRIGGIRNYSSFAEMLEAEDHTRIVPGMTEVDVRSLLSEIYPPNKEELGVIVIEVG